MGKGRGKTPPFQVSDVLSHLTGAPSAHRAMSTNALQHLAGASTRLMAMRPLRVLVTSVSIALLGQDASFPLDRALAVINGTLAVNYYHNAADAQLVVIELDFENIAHKTAFNLVQHGSQGQNFARSERFKRPFLISVVGTAGHRRHEN